MGNRYATSMHSQRKLNLKHWTQPGVLRILDILMVPKVIGLG